MEGREIREQGSPWTGTAFLVEALLLLLLLLATLAVFVSLLSRAITQSDEQAALDRAMVVATNTAESFSASPATYVCEPIQDGMDVTCSVTATYLEAGALYEALITVSEGGEAVYELSCARYVSGGGAA